MKSLNLYLAVFSGMFSVCLAVAGDNLLANSGIEDGDKKWSQFKTKDTEVTFSIDNTVSRAGKNSLKIDQKSPYPSYSSWITDNIAVNLNEETAFLVSLFVKAEDASYITVVVKGDKGYYKTVFSITGLGFFDWKEYKSEIKVPAGENNLKINLMQRDKGVVWFDDISLVKVIPKTNKSEMIVEKPATDGIENIKKQVR